MTAKSQRLGMCHEPGGLIIPIQKYSMDDIWLVVWNHGILRLSIQLGMSASQLTKLTPEFVQRGRLNHQPDVLPIDHHKPTINPP